MPYAPEVYAGFEESSAIGIRRPAVGAGASSNDNDPVGGSASSYGIQGVRARVISRLPRAKRRPAVWHHAARMLAH